LTGKGFYQVLASDRQVERELNCVAETAFAHSLHQHNDLFEMPLLFYEMFFTLYATLCYIDYATPYVIPVCLVHTLKHLPH
jgi:hypothetical protein